MDSATVIASSSLILLGVLSNVPTPMIPSSIFFL